ncbi:arsenic resistance N-acetyltransferase ArsN2 [Halomicrobium salinisoli]|uniref:arsenic resistance N-acetyltransferase ArsN2 n=1 Tax=Halomicrobium salinisoli TaxID=2878391 RepID=UPI001CF03E77|nr:arsenic resistance N-acetyltransferase ArsN2 [Halomicrobium salinisoli]
MDDAAFTLRPVDNADLSYVETLLEANGLPSRDVREKPECFYVARRGTDRIGVGGVEAHGTDGLLRSLVVEQSARGEGVGAAICDRLEANARADGVERLYLLTTTASSFFANRGYAEIDRSTAPDAIRRTTEFTDLCPESAICMRKRL